MRLSSPKLPALLVSCLIAVGVAFADDRDAIRSIVTDPGVAEAPGCAVGVFRDGVVVRSIASGLADVEKRKPIGEDTLFYAASVGKQFTALAIAKLVVAGKLALEDDARKYLPELPVYERPVTLRMLLHHTSGIRDPLTLAGLAGGNGSSLSRADALKLLFQQKAINFTPGTAFMYSNGGYLLLSEVVERVAGVPFAEFQRREILDPLGMKNSYFVGGERPAGVHVARGYVGSGKTLELRDTYPQFSGSGGLMTSVKDLARYDHDIAVARKVVTPTLQAIVTETSPFRSYVTADAALEPGTGFAYAGGLMIGDRNGQHFILHGGTGAGFKSTIARMPDRKLTVAVLCNRADWDSQEKADKVIDLVEQGVLTKGLSARYRSDELGATYDLTVSAETVIAKVSPSLPGSAGSELRFLRNTGGTYDAGGTRLVFDGDGRGFWLKTRFVTAIHFQRIG